MQNVNFLREVALILISQRHFTTPQDTIYGIEVTEMSRKKPKRTYILSPLRLPVSPRRHTRHIVPPAARPCQGQEARRAAAKNRPRRRQITNTRLLHLHGYFDRIINYCIIIIDRFGFEAHSAYEIP